MVDPHREVTMVPDIPRHLNEPLRKHVGGPCRPCVFEVADNPRMRRVSVWGMVRIHVYAVHSKTWIMNIFLHPVHPTVVECGLSQCPSTAAGDRRPVQMSPGSPCTMV